MGLIILVHRMSYYINQDSDGLGDLQKRLESTDLIPSHQPLLEGITHNFAALERAGCKSIRELRSRLKNAKTIALLANNSGVDPNYLNLLRRVVEGFFPKPQLMIAFDWLDKNTLAKLEKAGIKNTEQLYLAACSDIATLTKMTGLHSKDLSEPIALSDLSRVQWVSPTFARVLVASGFDNAAKVANANPEVLYAAVTKANESARFYKGKIGVRDMKRLVAAASYAP